MPTNHTAYFCCGNKKFSILLREQFNPRFECLKWVAIIMSKIQFVNNVAKSQTGVKAYKIVLSVKIKNFFKVLDEL
jgi:hypothetical protein